MQREIYFDASKYPDYKEAMEEHLKRFDMVIKLGAIGIVLVGIFLAVFTTWVALPTWITVLLLSVLVIGSIPTIAFGIFMKKRIRNDWEQKPLRITSEGIEFWGTVTRFNEFDRIVDSMKIVRGASPGFIALVKGKKYVRGYRRKALGDTNEFVKAVKIFHPEIRVDLEPEETAGND